MSAQQRAIPVAKESCWIVFGVFPNGERTVLMVYKTKKSADDHKTRAVVTSWDVGNDTELPSAAQQIGLEFVTVCEYGLNE
jgi:hypothetical protein